MITLIIISLLIVWGAYSLGHDNIDRTTVKQFDVERYMGVWYEVARTDVRFEQGLINVTATYTIRDGYVEVVNQGEDSVSGKMRKAVGRAKLTSTPGRLRVSFFWIFYSDYNVLELGENYDWALVGSRSPKMLWILSRTPKLEQSTLDSILQSAKQRGYNIEKLILF